MTPAGKDAQRTLARLTDLRTKNGELTGAQRDAQRTAELNLARDLNRQVLGGDAPPTTEAGQRAQKRLADLAPHLADMNPGQRVEVHGHRMTLENDRTAQRQAIEERQARERQAATGGGPAPTPFEQAAPAIREAARARMAELQRDGETIPAKMYFLTGPTDHLSDLGRSRFLDAARQMDAAHGLGLADRDVVLPGEADGSKPVDSYSKDAPATDRRGSTQLTLSPEDAKPIQNFAKSIPEKALYSLKDANGNEQYGRETEPHVTALYGLTGEGDSPEAVRRASAGQGPTKFKLGKLSLFSDPDKPYDVLKSDVESPDLHELNGKLKQLPHSSDYPDYHPHMTIAYVKKGEGDRYVGRDPFAGREFTLDQLTHSPADKAAGKTQIPLDGTGGPGKASGSPATGAPITAESALATARDMITRNRQMLRRRGVNQISFDGTSDANGSGLEFGGGRMSVDPEKLARQMGKIRNIQQDRGIPGTPADWFAHAMAEESVHGIQHQIARENGMTLDEFYGPKNLPDEAMPADWQEIGRNAYTGWDSLPSWAQKAEFARMVVQGRYTGKITEALYKVVNQVISYLKNVASAPDNDPRFARVVSDISDRFEQTQKDAHAREEDEHRAELMRSAKEGTEGAGGTELIDAIRQAGGIPTQDAKLGGELNNIREASKPGALAGYKGTFNLFRQDAPSLDELTSRLRAAGFDVHTPADTLDLIHQRLHGQKEMYGFPARDEAQNGMGNANSLAASSLGSSDALSAAGADSEADLKASLFGEKDEAAPTEQPSLVDRAKSAVGGVGDKLFGTAEHRANVDSISAGFDASHTMAERTGGQARNSVRLDIPDDLDRQAAGAVVEAGGNRAQLAADLDQVKSSPDTKLAGKYAPVYQHALDNLDRLTGATEGYRQMDTREDAAAEQAGLTPRWQARMKAIHDDPLSPESASVVDHGFGATPGYKTAADAIAAGVDPHSTDLADLAQHRVTENRRAINQHVFQNGLQDMKASDGKPIIGSVIETSTKLNPDKTVTTVQRLPKGYDSVQAGPNVLTVHKEFSPLLKSLYGESAIRQSGVGEAALNLAALAKHGTAVLDTYHAARVLAKEALGFQTVGYGKGLAVLDYAPQDRARAVAAGKITQGEADWAAQHEATIERGLKAGLNAGKVGDNLLEAAKQHGLIERLPVVGKGLTAVNDLIFHRLTRGAMTQAFAVAAKRNAARFPELSEAEIDRRSAREVNGFFGNLGNQGLLKSKTLQDAARLVAFAPNWTESQFTSEARGYAQAGQAVADAARGKGLRAGNIAQAMGGTVLASLVASQALNMFTRGKPTWKNQEDGHRWDAWIPGGPNRRGFWFSPLSIGAEYAHAMSKQMEDGHNVLDAAAHVASNKLSGPARGVKDLVSGEDYAGRPFNSTRERLTAAATDALPSPMPLSGTFQKDPKSPVGYSLNREPGSLEKQGFAMAGLKLDNAKSARAQMFHAAQPFRPAGGGSHPPSAYSDLRRMLDNGDLKNAAGEVRRLGTEGGKSVHDIGKALGIREDGTVKPELFTGSQIGEAKMLHSFSPEQRQLYIAAQHEHQAIARKFQAVAARSQVVTAG